MIARQAADLRLGEFAQRKQGARKLRLGEAEQEIGLVLGAIHGAQQLVAAGSGVAADARVMAGGDVVRAHGIGHLQKPRRT